MFRLCIRIVWIFLGFIALPGMIPADVSGQLTATAEVNPRLVRLGTPFEVILKIDSNENITIQRPSFPTVEGLTLSNSGTWQGLQLSIGGAHAEASHTLVAEYVASEAGTYKLGPFYIAYIDAAGQSHEITIPAVNVEVYEDAPRPASGIFLARIASWWKYILTVLLFALLAGLIAALIATRKKGPAAAGAVGAMRRASPEQDALDHIRRLEIPKADDAQDVKTYYEKVDDILRAYLTRRYNVPTRDATSWEIQREFQKRKRLDRRAKDVFVLINDCDWVKFAKSRPTQDEIRKVPDRAAEILVGGVSSANE